MIVALTLACGVACAVLVVAEGKQLGAVRVVAKLAASTAFVAIGVLALRAAHGHGHERFAQWILVGLILGAIGDAALLGHAKRAFLGGLVAFLAGHLAYVVAAHGLVPADQWIGLAGPYAALPAAGGTIALVLLWPKLGTMRVPVIVYVIAIVTMVVAAIAVARAHVLPDANAQRFAVGAALFFVSDLAVARDKFVARAFVNRAWGLPAYFAGQLLIAWSVLGV